MRLLEVVGLDPSSPAAGRGGARRDGSCRGLGELRDGHVLDLPERELQEAVAERAERGRVAGRQEAIGAFAGGVVLDALSRERLGNLARGLLGGEDERDVAAEDALEDRTDERVMGAAEDDRVDSRPP